ncbi:hypothetical protein TSTA_008220, partial [Talaromyces stipitatus ATCC 10500]
VMLASLEAAKDKLSIYYKDTDNIDGYLYAIGTILSPQDKLHLESSLEKYSENLAQEQQILGAPPTNTVSNAQPRTWWKYYQDEFPGMARLARDVLSIPASGAGAAKEERTQQQITVDPISDDEEDEGLSIEPRATLHGPSTKALGKRRLRDIAEDAESNQEDDSKVTSLLEIQHQVLGRVRKRS